VPGQVTGLVATGGNQQVTLAWTAPASDGGTPITSYNVYRSNSEFGAYAFIGTNTSATGFVDTGRDNSTTYFYKVSAGNLVGEGANSSVASATTWGVPGQVTGLVTTPGAGYLSLTWAAPATGGTPITGYAIYWSADNVFFTRIAVGIVTSLKLANLANGREYFVKVAAINAIGEGPVSTTSSATPEAPQDTGGIVVAIVIIAAAGGGIVMLFLLDKKGIITLKKKPRRA
jgi:fibronectin type 3 domain-containing protein